MSTKRYKAEQIVTVLRQIEVKIANGKTTPQACREAQIRSQHRPTTCLSLEKQVLQDVAEGNF